MFSFIFAFFNLYKNYVNECISIRILITNFQIVYFDIYAIPTYNH